MAHLSRPASAPSILAGFLNLAQRPIPVIRIHRLLEVPESAHGLYTQIIIFHDRNGIAVGWVVDQVTQIIPVSTDNTVCRRCPRMNVSKDCATGTFLVADSTVTILAPERVLLEKERQSIATFQEARAGSLAGTYRGSFMISTASPLCALSARILVIRG